MAFALVKLGSVSTGTTSVTAAFGQSTTAGDTLVAWAAGAVSSSSVSSPTTTASGWIEIFGEGNPSSGAACSAVWVKPNCGAGETAPTITLANGAFLDVLLGEFSGGAKSNIIDQSGGNDGTTLTPISAQTSADDTLSFGELWVGVASWVLSKSGTCTLTLTFNNGTATDAANNGTTSTADHYIFGYGTTTNNSGAAEITSSNSSSKISTSSLSLGTLLVPGTYSPNIDHIDVPWGNSMARVDHAVRRRAFYMSALKPKWNRSKSGIYLPSYA